jgi:hypothetical protein
VHELRRCALSGPCERSESNHLTGDYDTIWPPSGGGEIRVYKHMIKIQLSDYPFAKPMAKANWLKTTALLDGCGRK